MLAPKDLITATIAAANKAGVRFRWLGDDLEVTDLEQLCAPDRAQLERLLPGIKERLREPDQGDPEHVLERLEIEVELVENMERALEIVRDLPAEVGLDLETMTRGPLDQPWLAITKAGKRAARQPGPGDAPLDPHRGQPRLVSVYDPGRRISFVFDVIKLGGYPPGLLDRRVIGHNAIFDLVMLGAQGQAPASVIDTLQLTAMHLPLGRRTLEDVAQRFLGIPVPKTLQKSNWGTPELSTPQLAYAGVDPALAYIAGKAMHARLGERERAAFAVANRAVPAIARMRIKGMPFDRVVHAAWVDEQQQAFATQREEFERITGSSAPTSAPAVRAWLEARLPDEAKRDWPRTEKSRLLSIKDADIRMMEFDWPEVSPLSRLRKTQTLLNNFGNNLIDRMSPITGRIHTNFSLPMITGRMSSSEPNLQNLPKFGARAAFRAPAGKMLLDADLNQIELRIASQLSDDEGMRAAFAAGEDLHDRYAGMTNPIFLTLAKDDPERGRMRTRSKAGHFGNLFAQTVKGFRAYAWEQFGLKLTSDEAAEIQRQFYAMYPRIGPYQQEQFRLGQFGTLYSVAGRPRKAL
jgi:DNA polymerase-1